MIEETNEIKGLYRFFRAVVYVLLGVEFLVFVPWPVVHNTAWLSDIVRRIGRLGIYDNIIFSRLAVLIMMCVCCIGTRSRKDVEFNARNYVVIPLVSGMLITLLSIWIYPKHLGMPFYGLDLHFVLYMVLSVIGAVCMHVALDAISKAIKLGWMKDRYNWIGESFEQETKLIKTKESINIPTLFYWKRKMRNGWINIEQPFRGIWVVGVPGSGKTFSIIEPLIRQEAAKGWAMCVYDYKFPTLARKLYYQFKLQKKRGTLKEGSTFNVINFVDVERSKRVNPIQNRYISSVGEASETAVTLMEALKKGAEKGGGADDFFQKAAENFLAACIYFFVNYKVCWYDSNWNELRQEVRNVKGSDGKERSETVWVNDDGEVREPWRKKGRYADLPHVLALLQQPYEKIFAVLMRDPKVSSLVAPFQTAWKNKAMDQLEGMIGTLRVYVGRLVTPEAFWVLSGDDFDLKISDPEKPSYLLIANDPKMEAIITALNAVILNRLVSEVNTGEGKNNPVGIIVDELPTLYFNKIDRLQGTARSNKVSVALGFQSKEQLTKDYGETTANALLNIFGTVVVAASCGKDTVEWISNDIMGNIKQIKKGVSLSSTDTTVNLNEEMMPLLPATKIANMPAGWLCGMTARSFRRVDSNWKGEVDVEVAEEFQASKFYAKTNFDLERIKAEERNYEEIPKFYTFGTEEEKEYFLGQHYKQIYDDVTAICDEYWAIQKEEDEKKAAQEAAAKSKGKRQVLEGEAPV